MTLHASTLFMVKAIVAYLQQTRWGNSLQIKESVLDFFLYFFSLSGFVTFGNEGDGFVRQSTKYK